MTFKFFVSLFLFVLGIIILDTGILSVLVAIAYSDFKGSVVPAICGIFMVSLGGFFIVRAKRRLIKKDEKKEGTLY
jgi:uncharacterized membrane protein HdeD (DUF308 family)